jgi:integrase
MLFKTYSRYVPNLTRSDGAAMERLLAAHINADHLTQRDPVALRTRATSAEA